MLLRVELGANWDDAVALQKQFKFEAIGTPKQLPEIPKTVMFDIEKPPTVEAFDFARLALDTEADINPGMETVAANARIISEAVKDPAERARVDKIIRDRGLKDYAKGAHFFGARDNEKPLGPPEDMRQV